MSSTLDPKEVQDWIEKQDDGYYVRRVCDSYHHSFEMMLGPFKSEFDAKITLGLLGPYPVDALNERKKS